MLSSFPPSSTLNIIQIIGVTGSSGSLEPQSMLKFTTSLLTVINILKPANYNSQKSQPKICALSLYNHVVKTVLPGKVHD